MLDVGGVDALRLAAAGPAALGRFGHEVQRGGAAGGTALLGELREELLVRVGKLGDVGDVGGTLGEPVGGIVAPVVRDPLEKRAGLHHGGVALLRAREGEVESGRLRRHLIGHGLVVWKNKMLIDLSDRRKREWSCRQKLLECGG